MHMQLLLSFFPFPPFFRNLGLDVVRDIDINKLKICGFGKVYPNHMAVNDGKASLLSGQSSSEATG